jgi:flagellar protein FlgJ
MTLPLPAPLLDSSLAATPGSLASLRSEVATHNPKALRAAAQQFESLFINMMLKSMHDANFKDSLLGSSASRMYQDMYDQQLSVELSKDHTFGLAELLVQQLRRQGARPAPAVGPGRAPALGGVAPVTDAAAPASMASAASASPPPVTPAQQSAFARSIWPDAERTAQALGVTPVALVAQAALETDWGRRIPQSAAGASSNNLFGIKAGADWAGPSVNDATAEYLGARPTLTQATFRAYGSCDRCFQDYGSLLSSDPRYSAALGTGHNVAAFAAALQRGGYATDPNYAAKLTAVADTVQRVLGAEPLKLPAGRPIATLSRTL